MKKDRSFVGYTTSLDKPIPNRYIPLRAETYTDKKLWDAFFAIIVFIFVLDASKPSRNRSRFASSDRCEEGRGMRRDALRRATALWVLTNLGLQLHCGLPPGFTHGASRGRFANFVPRIGQTAGSEFTPRGKFRHCYL
eukprot:3301725-Amphidinium_carterae.1